MEHGFGGISVSEENLGPKFRPTYLLPCLLNNELSFRKSTYNSFILSFIVAGDWILTTDSEANAFYEID